VQELVPLDFASLGFVEFAWLVLAGTGLSLAVTAEGWRGKFARNLGLVCVGAALLRQYVLVELEERDLSAWEAWVGPAVVAPLLLAACTLAGIFRPALSPRVRALWPAALLAWTVAARPFDASLPEWLYVAFAGATLVALVQTDGAWRAFLIRPVAGRVRAWPFFALAFVFLCWFTKPFGFGWRWALAHGAVVWLLYAMFEQGEEMRRYVMRRLVGAPIVILIILVLSFVMMRTAPGGPFTKEKAVDPALQAIREARRGYDDPWPEQFAIYIATVAWEGDPGFSSQSPPEPPFPSYVDTPMEDLVARRLP